MLPCFAVVDRYLPGVSRSCASLNYAVFSNSLRYFHTNIVLGLYNSCIHPRLGFFTLPNSYLSK